MEVFNHLTLVFENGDDMRFSWDDVASFYLGGVKELHMKDLCGDLSQYLTFDEGALELSKKANGAHYLFGVVELAESKFRYLLHAPITQLIVELGDESITYFLRDEQTIDRTVSATGNLLLTIR